jgi:hypothetical protein
MTHALTAATLIALAAGAAPGTIPPTDNAALAYWQLNVFMDRDEIRAIYDEMVADEQTVAPGSDNAAKLEGDQDKVSLALKGAFTDECDFEIDYSQGFDTLLPHLGMMRVAEKLLGADARRLLLARDVPGAARRTAALYRMAGQIKGDGVLISSLVGVAIANTANVEANRLIEHGLSDDDRRLILAAINTYDDTDPYDVIESIRMEQQIVRDWVKRKFTGETAAKDFFDSMGTVVGTGPGGAAPANPSDPAAPLQELGEVNDPTTLTKAEFDAEVDRAADVYDDLIKALESPEPGPRLEEISAEIGAGQHGAVAKAITPNLSRMSESNLRAIAELASVKAKLQKGE